MASKGSDSMDLTHLGHGRTVRSVAKMELPPNARRTLDDIGTPDCPGPRDRSSLDADERRAIILLLLTDGVQRREMSEILGISMNHVATLVKEVRAHIAENIRITTVEEYAGMVRVRMERIFNMLMTEAHTATESVHRIAALKEAKATLSELVRCLQQMGIVYKEPERLRIEHEVRVRMVAISKVFIEGMEKYIGEDSKKSFGRWMEGRMKELGIEGGVS